MSEVFTKYKKLRVLEDKKGLLYIQDLKFGLIWWTVFKTYHHRGALAFLEFSGLKYNADTGYYE